MYAPDPTTEHTDNFVAAIHLSKNYRIKLAGVCVLFSIPVFKFQICETPRGGRGSPQRLNFHVTEVGGRSPLST